MEHSFIKKNMSSRSRKDPSSRVRVLAVNRPGAVYSHANCDVGFAYLRLCASCCQSKPRRTVSVSIVDAYFAFEVNAAAFDNITFTNSAFSFQSKENV